MKLLSLLSVAFILENILCKINFNLDAPYIKANVLPSHRKTLSDILEKKESTMLQNKGEEGEGEEEEEMHLNAEVFP